MLLILSIVIIHALAQYPPAVGQPGSTAIHADSSVFMNWAKSCSVKRGYYDIAYPADSIVSNGTENDALGKADASTISLGDSGMAILTFSPPVSDEQGPDFAVFENSFDGQFLELAFVEVSSDSLHWYRFDAVSLTQDTVQVPGFGLLDPAKINNLAGKYRAFYGTPFDLQELNGKPYLNIDSVSYVRIIDVIGSISPEHSSYDSQGNKINDPYPTPFATGGFDLDAVGVIHERPQGILQKTSDIIKVFPNPCRSDLFVSFPAEADMELFDVSGNTIIKTKMKENTRIDVTGIIPGIYILKIHNDINSGFEKIIVQ